MRAGVASPLGEQAILPSEIADPFLFDSFVFDSEFVACDPAIAHRITLALDEAVRFVRANEEEARRIATRYLPRECAELSDGMGRPRFLTSEEVDAAHLQTIADLFAAERVIGGHIDVAPWVASPRTLRGLARRPRPDRTAERPATTCA